MGVLMQTTTALAGINILLLLSLLILYVMNFIKLRVSFTIGLILFTSMFLIHNIAYFYLAIKMVDYFSKDLDLFVLIFTSLQTIAFSILTFITWKY